MLFVCHIISSCTIVFGVGYNWLCLAVVNHTNKRMELLSYLSNVMW